MPLLTRQQTLESLSSWWSDRNPNLRGPTINIHAAAKPLMKLLYNRQALEFIGKIDGMPLSAKDAEIYGRYLSCEYVSVSTKSAILEDLYRRAHFEHDALVVQAHIFDDILKLCEGPITEDTRMWDVHSILLRLTEHDATAAATCGSLVALLCDSVVPQINDGALWVLFQAPEIKFPSVTTGVSVEVKLLDRLSDMLEDSFTLDSAHQGWILQIISKLVAHESTAIAVVEAKLLDRLLDMLKDSSTAEWDQQWILRIISNLASHESTAIAVVGANTLNTMLENLVSHESTAMAVVRMLPLDLLGTLWRKSFEDIAPIDVLASRLKVLVTTNLLSAQHKATAEATSSSLVAIFCDSDIPQVVDGTLWLLSRVPHIKFPPVITGVSVEAKLLDHIADMLKAPNTPKWRYLLIFQMLSYRAPHESSARVMMEQNVPNSMKKLLRSRPTDLYPYIFPILENLASHESTAMAVIRMLPFDLLGTLWRKSVDDTVPIDVLASRLEVLVTSRLLMAPRQATAEATCNSLVALVWLLMGHYGYYLVFPISSSRRSQLEYLWRQGCSPALRTCSKFRIPQKGTIQCIARWQEGAEGVVTAKSLDNIRAGLNSRDVDIRLSTCELLRALIEHESTVQAVVAIVSREYVQALSRFASVQPRYCKYSTPHWKELMAIPPLSRPSTRLLETTSTIFTLPNVPYVPYLAPSPPRRVTTQDHSAALASN
ncbi:hypothetical protein C8J57DRAFT_1590226 [Mycena rebaudengoi]|nr:hypothetical protein C8J57DRAFT_1590226 [Mycena rebaudengoi]